eukprot:1194298-Prorocentrum_minimum.AAC.3
MDNSEPVAESDAATVRAVGIDAARRGERANVFKTSVFPRRFADAVVYKGPVRSIGPSLVPFHKEDALAHSEAYPSDGLFTATDADTDSDGLMGAGGRQKLGRTERPGVPTAVAPGAKRSAAESGWDGARCEKIAPQPLFAPPCSSEASHWSVVRIYLRFLRPIGLAREYTHASCV